MKKYMTTAELAEHLSVSVSKVKEMMETGAIPADTYFRHQRTYRFHTERVENYLLGIETVPQGVEVQTRLDLPEFENVQKGEYNE